MNADFFDAHDRHRADADLLFTSGRWANADHMYGLAAECGLKRLMLAFGMPFDAARDRPSDRDDRLHIDDVWDRFETYRSGSVSGTGYSLPATNLFGDWTASQRYAHQASFDEPRALAHQIGATEVQTLLKKAQNQGLI